MEYPLQSRIKETSTRGWISGLRGSLLSPKMDTGSKERPLRHSRQPHAPKVMQAIQPHAGRESPTRNIKHNERSMSINPSNISQFKRFNHRRCVRAH